jgi:phospholipid transport system substrate-binding protein
MTAHGTLRSPRQSARALGIICMLLAGAFAAHAARAADGASGFISSLSHNAVAIIKNPDISKSARLHYFEILMADNFDLPRIAQFVLGDYWQPATAAERQQFTTAFGAYLTGIYFSRFADYNACSFRCAFRVTTQFPANASTTMVKSEIVLVATGAAIDLTWVVEKTPDSYKVIDVATGRASLSWAQRKEFSSVVHRSGGSISSLIQLLQQKSTELSGTVP